MTIKIAVGAMCDPIYRQLKKQGVVVSASDVYHFQRAVDGFIRLRIMGCMGDKEADRIGQRLMSKIAKFVENKLADSSIGDDKQSS